MDTKSLTDLNPAVLAALAKTIENGAKATRENLQPGTYKVDTVVTLVVGAEVKVLPDQEAVLTPQKARPWELVLTLLEELNMMRAAAGHAGIDLAKVVELAEKVDPELAKEVEKEADAVVAHLKEPTRQTRKGAVRVKGVAALPA